MDERGGALKAPLVVAEVLAEMSDWAGDAVIVLPVLGYWAVRIVLALRVGDPTGVSPDPEERRAKGGRAAP